MKIMTIVTWLINHWKIAAKAIFLASVGLLLIYGINTHNKNKKLSEELELAQNNIEAYQDAVNGSWWASNVLKLDLAKMSEQNDSLLQELDKVRKEAGIKPKELTAAATQTQTVYVSNSKEVEGDIITILKDSIYSDSLQYNDLTKIYYTIGKDSVNIALDLKNTQYLYVYKHREYKNKKNFFKRLITFDWKKITKYKYQIINTNDLIDTKDVRVVETIDK